ncbi:vWA domain-containing protein [Flavobacterium algicola]|uniref:vWA domain-containing protein n=1 Tax=Flavobacterium algicola TaxID=556529 RepID=UPI001EFEA2C8|nr:BatA and WFA domain-containing protein [Flavobacterium algicola]MCG9790995.1 BatA and WFA domain-containing protein [Flavobacterium algicola]
MQFKHPELLYFLFLLIVPILVHLFQLRRFKKEYFTNVRFLKALTIQTRKSATIKKWLLLATRLLLLASIIIAFAQPFFEATDSKNNSNELYVILDNSLSMQAKGQKGELLKRAVQELLENIPEEITFSLLTNSETFWNTSKKEIQSELQNLDYSAIPFQAESLLTQVQAHKSVYKKDIIIITDAIGLEKKQLQIIKKEDNAYFIVPKAEQKNNIAIDSVYIEETLENFYDIRVRLTSQGDPNQKSSIAIYNGTKLIAKTVVTFEQNKKTIPFTIPKQDFHGKVSIEDNGLAFDNDYFFTILQPKKNAVLSIGALEKSNFLSRIYTADEFSYRNSLLSSLDYNSIEKQDAIVLNEIETIPTALQTTLKSFVQKGGNLIVIPAATAAIGNINDFLKLIGNIQLQPLAKVEKQITKINYGHPLFTSVFEGKVSNFQYPKTNTNFEIVSGNSIAFYYQDGSSFLTSVINPTNSVSVFSAPLNSSNSNFQQSPLIVPAFYKMATMHGNNAINARIIGDSEPYLIEAELSKDAILSVGNKGEEFIPTQQAINDKVKLTFNEYPNKAGNFEIYSKKTPLENISFNYNRTESQYTTANEASLDGYKTVESISAVISQLQTDRTDSVIWKWFVIFALLFLLLEMAIIRFLK